MKLIFNFIPLLILLSPLCYSSEDLNYKMVKVPAGSFNLLIPLNDSVKITYIKKSITFKRDFFIGAFEVSNELWSKCYTEKFCTKKGIQKEGEKNNHPIVRINWHDAYQFTKWFSKVTKKKYRLPTEEEWAYAINMGQDYKESENFYNYERIDLSKLPRKVTRPLGSINRNKWGIYDFKGNVWEWTLTCWFGSKENILKQTKASELNSPKICNTRIAQGENRSHIPDFIYNTYNGGCSTLRPAANLGFRMVREQ